MSAGTIPIVQTHDHVCLIHYGETSRRPVLLQWTREGLASNERVLLVEPPEIGASMMELLGDTGDRVVVVAPEDAYRGDHDPRALTHRLTESVRHADDGAPPIRKISSPASHALSVIGDVGTYLEYEEQLEGVAQRDHVGFLCQYDHVALDEDVIIRAAAAHTVVVQLDDLALPTLDLRPIDGGVRVSGEIDAANASVVASWMSRHKGRPLRVDCSNLTFMDVAGYRAVTTFVSDDAPIVFTRVNGVPKKLLSLLPEELNSGHVFVGTAEP
jgi:hypothetical protein